MKVILYVDILFEPITAAIYYTLSIADTIEKYNIFYII